MSKIINEESHLEEKDSYSKEEINSIPVFFCADCLSLEVRRYTEGQSYCDKCYCTNIETDSIEQWKLLYKERYGHSFITKK